MDDTVAKALHAVRHHLAGGGFLSDLFSGPDYLSTGEVASPTNWGDPESAADFFKADRALRLAREVQASEPARDMPLPLRRPAPEAAPRQQVAAPPPAPAPAPAQAFRPVATLPIGDVEPHDFPPVTTPSLAFSQPVYGEKTQRLGGGEDQNKAPAVQMDYTIGNAGALWPSSGNDIQTYEGIVPEDFNEGIGNPMSVDDVRQSMMFRPEPRAEISRAVSLARNLAPAQPEAIPSAADALAAVEKFQNAGIFSGNEYDKAGEILAAHNRAKFDNIPVEEALRLIRAAGPMMINQGMPREERRAAQPLAYAETPAPAPAVNAIDQATGKLTARIPEEPFAVPLTAKQGDYIARTIATESSGDPAESRAIADVILNRIRSGRFGSSPEAVLFAKNQFEPWMNPAGKNYPLKVSPKSQKYLSSQEALEEALTGGDTTGGAYNFWGPGSQFALGRDTPKFARDMPDYVDIGATRFHRPNSPIQMAQAQAQEVPSTGLFAFGTNDPNPQTALKSAQQIYENARRAGIEPVFVLPNSADPRFAPISEALKKYADERGIKYETPGYDPKDPLHITPDTAKEIAKKYPGALVGGDSNSWRLQKYGYGRPVSSPNAFVDKGTGVKLGQVGAGSPDVAKWFGQYVDRLSRGRAHGGLVDDALHVVRERHADGEAVGPTMQQRLRETIASIDPERSQDQPVMDPATMGEAWNRARQNYQNFPVQEGEAVARPLELGARDMIGGAIAGGAREPGAQFRRGVADLLVGSTGLPDSGTLGVGVADLPMVTGIPLTLADMARDVGQGDYGSAAMGAALPAAFYARGPLGAAGRRAVEIAKDYAKPIAGAAGVTATMTPEDAEAAKLSKALQIARGIGHNGGPSMSTIYSDLSKNKHMIPVEEMSAEHVPTIEMLRRTIVSPESLQGSILTPAVGDRTKAGHNLVGVNGEPLAYPVSLEGGPDFMRSAANQAEGSIWASDPKVISGIAKYGKKLGETGKDVNFIYSSMGARSGDFSHMMADALLAQMQGKPISREAMQELNDAMARQNPNWPGLRSTDEDAIQAARKIILANGPMRKQFAEEIALGNLQGKGFPDIGSTRYAITEPAMIGQPTGMSGYAISKLDPSGKVIKNPEVPHTTYPTQLGGKGYLGGFEHQIPREIMFPDFYAGRRAEGRPSGSDDRAFSLARVSQDANQQWLDNVMKYLERRRRSID